MKSGRYYAIVFFNFIQNNTIYADYYVNYRQVI